MTCGSATLANIRGLARNHLVGVLRLLTMIDVCESLAVAGSISVWCSSWLWILDTVRLRRGAADLSLSGALRLRHDLGRAKG